MPPITRSDRAARVMDAANKLAACVRFALTMEANQGPDDPRTLAAWEHVEAHGATVHRQARLLAGKSKGG